MNGSLNGNLSDFKSIQSAYQNGENTRDDQSFNPSIDVKALIKKCLTNLRGIIDQFISIQLIRSLNDIE